MTTILKDSLGGNCKTVMIATVNPEIENYDESVSTLKFSQRVGLIENEVKKNEKIDIQVVINNLKEDKGRL